MNIAIIWYWENASKIYPDWRDGLRAALEEINKEHKVTYYFDKKIPKDEYDAYIIWGDSTCEAIELIRDYKGKKGIFLTTDPVFIENLRGLDAIYCESEPVYQEVRNNGMRAIKAFGTDTDFFKPKDVEKTIDFFYPATFSPWKMQSEIAYLGKQLLCVGTVQPDGNKELFECVKNGVRVEEGYFPVERILKYYQRSKNVIIPAIHGSERTVLEAMSCGIKPQVLHRENKKTYSYIQELEDSGLEPREFVLKNYSHIKYAENIMKGLS